MYKVYYLPKCNYCGTTGRDIKKRLWEHSHEHNRDVTGVEILAEFESKRDALDYERKYQETNNANGLIYTDKWRNTLSKRTLESPIYLGLSKKVVCVDTGEIFESTKACARKYKGNSSGLARHLKGHRSHSTFCKLRFKYVNEEDAITANRVKKITVIRKPKHKTVSVMCIEDDMRFHSIAEAAQYYNIHPSTICLQFNGVIKKSRIGKTFKRIENNNL